MSYENAFNRVRPLVEAIAVWEREKGSACGLLPSEYSDFIRHIQKGLFLSSCRGALDEVR